jgi:uncharacterized protein YndB with AHSA1/START domain
VASYSFLTTWILEAPCEAVWDAIHEVESWPAWWRGVRRVDELEHGDEDGIGAVYRHEWRSVIPYPVRFETRIVGIQRLHLIEAEAHGDLAGTGRWRFFDGSATVVTYEWNVRTTKPWMNLLAPVARPIFAWNHHAVMRNGGVGLTRKLGARLVAQS